MIFRSHSTFSFAETWLVSESYKRSNTNFFCMYVHEHLPLLYTHDSKASFLVHFVFLVTANRIACFVFYSRSREMNNFIAIVVLRLEVKICIGDHCLSWCCGRSGMSAVVTFSQSRVIGFLSRFPCVLYGIYSSIKEINNSFVGV